ncbi:hypothetical protein ASE04_09740 [Rhizobium sp. Root708]|uniref:DUF6074 family protein n=1 Tax=Rhizobium sp. Root708 TaxID=1736592 RepID=UPI0006FE3A22|nr:DUF6074 family protein [Rhizobium sp. Root708]KRB51802.1 hypothetical protein ASE04_09740 [Rhizobium sp. Root708]
MSECQMIPFPLKARVGKVRRCAEVLQTTAHKATRESYWFRTVAQLRAKLEEIGLPDEQVREQVRGFRTAVENECHRRNVVEIKARNAPDGAA